MKCRKPFMNGLQPCPCGQCLPCRINRRRMWKHRIMLEATQHQGNCFITLTYDDEHLPEDGSLRPRDLQLFMKLLRRRLEPQRIRFFAVGEYGDENKRPHYHAVLFGMSGCQFGQSRYWKSELRCCDTCRLVAGVWGKGRIHVGTLEGDSAQYVCGYVIKKMTKEDDPRLEGRHPEFGRMSRRPGIGVDALFELADTLMKYEIAPDITTLQHGRSHYPLGRFLRGRLAEMCGEELNKKEGFDEEVLAVLDTVGRVSPFAPKIGNGAWPISSVKDEIVKLGDQKVLQLEQRLKRANRRRL